MDLQAAFITLATLIVGALSGAGFNAYFNQRAEKSRVQEGYKEKVYEKVVESILTVHQAYTDFYHNADEHEASNVAHAVMDDQCQNFSRILKANRLYYPMDLYVTMEQLVDDLYAAATSGEFLAVANVRDNLYTNLATKKLNFMGLEILDVRIEKKKPKLPSGG